MAKCFGNKNGSYCKSMKEVEVDPNNEHKIVERSKDSYTCAWCIKHDCPCMDKDYHCKDIELVKGHWNENMEWIEEQFKED